MTPPGPIPFVSVVVPCYNAVKTVGECLASLQGQTYPRESIEILLVDNGSTDGTIPLVQSKFPQVRLLSCTVKGSGYVRNVGIEAARGELILSTDSDCVCDPAWAARLVAAMAAAPASVAAIGGRIAPYSTRTAVERYTPIWVSQPDPRTRANGVSYAATTNAIFRTAVLRQLGGFDGTAGHDDSDLGLRMLAAGYRIEYAEDAVVQHRNPVSLRELYEHRVKYGERNYILSGKHPHVLGDPGRPGVESAMVRSTIRRVAGDLLVKLPLAVLRGSGDLPRTWPLIDAVSAWGNLKGFRHAVRQAKRRAS